MDPERDREELPADGGELVAEDPHRMEELTHVGPQGTSAYDGGEMAAGHSVDEYLETIYFLAFPIGEYHPQRHDPADALVAGRRDARRLARVGRARC